MTAMALLDFLLGAWVLERRLVDERLGAEGRFEGIARFTPEGPGTAAYREEGTVRFLDHVGAAHRDLRCAGVGEGSVAFSFPDGRAFHLLELRPEGYEAEHRCGEDRYLGRFCLVDEGEWHATWRVEGPRKALLLEGAYRRTGPHGAPGSAAVGGLSSSK